jgi:hypothetical protein
LVERRAEVKPVKYGVPDTVSAVEEENVAFQLVNQPVVPERSVVVAFAKVLRPENVFSFARSVELAAVIVMFAVPSKEVPLMVRAVSSAVAVPAFPPMLSEEVATWRSAVPALSV